MTCATNSDCPGQTQCHEGQCRTGCTDDASCVLGSCNQKNDCSVCIDNGECSGNRCIRNTCQVCRTTSDCPSGVQCTEGDCIQIIDPAFNCGNGVLQVGEECDDSNRISNDGCSSECFLESTLVAAASICGNGVLEQREECDDSNRRDDDGCSSTCLLEIGICGDGIVQSLLGEQCESSTHNPALPYLCKQCRFYSLFCGDNKVDAGEECDAGPLNSTSPDALCRPDCGLLRCGDSILDNAETCDDGNRLNNDGCDRYCREETQVASDKQQIDFTNTQREVTTTQFQNQQQLGFPQYPNFKQLPYQLPLAQLQPLIQSQAPIGDTGPAAVAVVASGMAAGMGWMRRKRK